MNYKNVLIKLLQKRYKRIIAAEVLQNCITITAVNCSGRVQVAETLVQEMLPDGLNSGRLLADAEMLADYLKNIFKRENLQGDALIFTVGAENSALISLELPYLAEKELHEAAKWEINAVLEGGTGNFYHAAAYVTDNKTELNKATAAVIPQRAGRVFAEAAARLDLPLAGVFLRSSAIEATLTKSYKKFLLLDCIAAGEYILTAFNNGLPVYQKQIGTDGSFMETLAEEIKLLQASLKDAEFKQIIVNNADVWQNSGDLIKITGAAVIVNDIKSSIGFAETINPECMQKLNGFAAVIGAALCFVNTAALNIMPLQQFIMPVEKWKAYRVAAVGCIVCMLAAWAWHLADFYNTQRELETVQTKIAALGNLPETYAEQAEHNARINKRLQLAAQLKNNETRWNDMLVKIADSVPNGCWIERIEESGREKQLAVKGFALNMDKAVMFAELLGRQNSGLRAEITELKTEQLDGRKLVGFNLLIERK